MAQLNKIKSFKSFSDVMAQDKAVKIAEENATKRGELTAKIAALLDEMNITSFDDLEEDVKREFITKAFGSVSEEEAGIEAEELEDETKVVDSDVEQPEDVEKELDLEGEGDAEGEEITEAEEAEVSEEEAEETEEVNAEESNPTVSEMLKEVYEMVKNEAKVWEEDAHDEHTVESYMKENAALVAALSANTLKEMKEEFSVEAYEAACNEMIEAYTKKINEMKEADSVSDAEDAAE